MTYEDYINDIIVDGKQYIKEFLEYDKNADLDEIIDAMFVSNVTGNDNGSYYCNSYKAKQAVKDVIFEDWFKDMCDEFGVFERKDVIDFLYDPESLDVSVRCYLLGSSEVIEAFENYYSELTF